MIEHTLDYAFTIRLDIGIASPSGDRSFTLKERSGHLRRLCAGRLHAPCDINTLVVRADYAAHQFLSACIITGITLFAVGAARVFVTGEKWYRGDLEMLLGGGLSAAVAYLIGAAGRHRRHLMASADYLVE
ncbi:MAG TPA: hypothetical protein GXX50_05420 [Firmicutes bacterium]|nr:hypothetical protein [Bacillota bacterium]